MINKIIKILLIEDNPGDARLLKEMLKEVKEVRFELIWVDCISKGLEYLEKSNIDVILLDLGLPDSHGLESFYRLHTQIPDIPVVVITGLNDEETGLQAVRNGAQDFMVKGNIQPQLLSRSLRYAVERYRLLHELTLEREKREQERNEAAFRELSNSTSVVASLYGEKLLSESSPKLFVEFVKEYRRLLDLSLEKQVKRINYDISYELRNLADRLGEVGAGPRDIIQIHKSAIKKASETEKPVKLKALTMEGRFIVLELMGYLVSFYRRLSFGCIRYQGKRGDNNE